GNRSSHKHHVAALAQSGNALAAERERLDLQLELVARAGAHQLALDGRLAHHEPTSSSSSAFCAWRRFSAWSQMRWRSPYSSSAEISSPGCAGRSCIAKAPSSARSSSALWTR